MSNTARLQQGNTFACTFAWTPGTTGPADLTDTTLASTLKDKCGSEYALTVVKAEDGLSFTVYYDGDTSDWAIGQADWDIKFTFPGSPTIPGISHCEMFRVIVIETVTA